MPMTVDHRRFFRILHAFVLLAVTALVLYPALTGGFIFDDYPIFAENPAVHVQGWHWQAWWSLWIWSHVNIQRPLAMFSFAFNYACSAGTWGFKATNLVIHLFNAMLVLLFSRRLLAALWAIDTFAPRVEYWALGIAMAWAIHPLQVSAVMYVVQRMELLGFTFVLLALITYWHGRQYQMAGQRAWPWLCLSAAITLIGYSAKETVALVPGYALLIELTVLRFAAARPAIRHFWKVTYAAGCLVALAVLLGYLLPHYATAAVFAGRDYTAWQRELTQLRVLPMYLGWSVLPLPSHLQFYYDNYPISTSLLHPIDTLFGGIFLLILLGLAMTLRHRRPLLALGIGWFFMAHALTSSPLPLELVFEHRNYPALFGVMLALSDVLWLIDSRLRTRLPIILAMLVIVYFGFLTTLRAATWGEPLQLALSLSQSNPGSSRAALDLARRYVSMSGDNPDVPTYSLGIKELERAAMLPSYSILPENALLIQAANHPGLDSRPWWASLQYKLQNRTMGPETYLALGGLLQARLDGNTKIDAQQLGRAFEIATTRNPQRVSLHVQYAELAARALHDPHLAIEQWQQTVALEKDTNGYPSKLAIYLIDNHRNQEALAVIAKAQAMQPALLNDVTLKSLRVKAEQTLGPQNKAPTGS